MLMLGGFLSIMLPAIGPAAEQFPATSHTGCVPVDAFAVSVPAGTLVLREKPASDGFARPEPESVATQGMLTSLACQRPSVPAQEMDGGVLSRRIIRLFTDSALPALSVAKNVMVVKPSLEMTIEAELPFTEVLAMDCAPLALRVICFRPEPPGLSVAVSAKVTLLLFQPAALGWGESDAAVAGAIVSLPAAPGSGISMRPVVV